MERKILVVDDEQYIREMITEAFRITGFQVKAVETAEVALDILQTENFQLFILDLNLPGMNGIELCKRIRKLNPTASIFAISGYASMFHLVDALEAGFNDFFAKPFQLKTLQRNVVDSFEKMERWRGLNAD